MSYVIKLCLIAVITAICALVLKSHKSELVPLCLVAGGVGMVLYCFDYLSASISFIKEFSESTGIDNSLVRTIFKIIGIGFIFELTAGSVKELGFEGVADKLVLCGKIIIFIVSIPVFQGVYQIIVSLTELA